MSRLRSPGHEVVILQACHPRFFATHRYLVYGLPASVQLRDGRIYSYGKGARIRSESARASLRASPRTGAASPSS